MAASNYSLKVNRELLDPNFESYRLSLDAIPTYNVELDAAVEEVKLKDTQYTLEHMRAFGMYNYLHLDPWYEDSVLFVDCKGRVLSLTVTLDTALGKPREVYRITADSSQCEDRLCASLSLTSATWAALSDGTGRLHLLRTGKRGDSSQNKWEPLFSEDMGEPFTILHSISHVQAGVHTMEVLLLRIQKDPQETKGSGYSVSLEWITVANTAGHGQEKKYETTKRRVLRGKSVPHYAAVEPQGKGLMVASEKPFVFTHVDGRPVELPDPEPMEVEKTDPIYFWQQTAEDITVCVRMPEGVTKEEVQFRLTADNIRLGVQGFPPLLEGQLYASVDTEASAWIIKNDKSLEVTLQKRSEGPMWSELVMGDRRGECVQIHSANSGRRTMKVLVVLVLAVFSGCQANLFYADAPKPQLEVMTDAFWDYVGKATQTADDTLQMIRKSQFGQDVSARLTESADTASTYAVSLQEQLPPVAQDLITKVTTEADVLIERVIQELNTAKDKLEPYTEDMKAQIQQRVEQLKQELAPYAESVDSEALRTTLMQKSEELKTSLEQSMKDLQAQLGPYTDDLKQKVDQHLVDFKESLVPVTERVQSELTRGAQQVKEIAAPYVDDLRERLDPYAQDLQARLTSLYESFTKAN